MECFFDCETSGFINPKLTAKDPKQAWAMQIAYILSDQNRTYVEFSSLITSEGRSCNSHAQKVHQISIKACDLGGASEKNLLNILLHGFLSADLLVAHNITFDLSFVEGILKRCDCEWEGLRKIPAFCTMHTTTNLCQLPFPKMQVWKSKQKYKWPKLTELYQFLFNEELVGAHDALTDVRATQRCYYRLMKT